MNTPIIRIATSIEAADPTAWDACANPPGLLSARDTADHTGERYNPFIAHGFLAALEASGSVGGRTGWQPAHVLVEDKDSGLLRACAPCYLKNHSMGEYVFDHAFADAYARAGGEYYPKVQVASPFSPVTGRRLLLHDASDLDALKYLLAGLDALRDKAQASSIHVTFPTGAEANALAANGYLQRTGQQFHFLNEGYADFEGFLAALASRKRKTIRRERKEALANGITIEHVTGAALTKEHWDAFFAFYMDTGERKWGRPYLTRKFFTELGARMADRTLLIMARREGKLIAGALNMIGDDALYGRNWGAVEEHPFLHFEVCYYQAIEFAINHGLSRVEAGAQGEHKLARGYLPVATHSAHRFADARLSRAVADYLKRERMHVQADIEALETLAPFRKDQPET